MKNEYLYDVALSFDESLTPIEKVSLYEKYGSSRKILELKVGLLKNVLGRKWTGKRFIADQFIENASKLMDFIEKSGIKILRFFDDAYPFGLRHIPDYPYLIYYRGNIDYDFNRSIAIVGTRTPDNDGINRAKEFSSFLAENGFTIISGLAQGIDAISHNEAIRKQGKTFAVMGNGIDKIYPFINNYLGRAIVNSNGCLISEYPPGITPKKWYFPRRNRIIVGLSRFTLIVQSPKKSGSIISAMLTGDYNRDLFVCSPIEQSHFDEGNEILIRTGGTEVKTPFDLIQEINY